MIKSQSESSTPADDVEATAPSFDYRDRAASFVGRAKDHLDSGDERRVVYACLELRHAIESLTYDLVRVYRDDLSDAAMEDWHPRRIFHELKDANPAAFEGLELRIGPGPNGSGPTVRLKERKLHPKRAAKLHGALGAFLHERTLLSLEEDIDIDYDLMRAKAGEVLAELGAVLDSNGFNLRIDHTLRWKCACGSSCETLMSSRQIKKRTLCKTCGQLFTLFRDGDSVAICLRFRWGARSKISPPIWEPVARVFRSRRYAPWRINPDGFRLGSHL